MVSPKLKHPTSKNGTLRVLITGASTGIGAATACVLGQPGNFVGVQFHSREKQALGVVDRIRAQGGSAECFQADLTDRTQRAALIRKVIETLGGLNALVNNAGDPTSTSAFPNISEDDWSRALRLHAESPFFLAQSAFEYMREHGGGRIINISSIGVKFGGSPATLHYAAAKGALETLTVGMAKIGATCGILVNAVRPGIVRTRFWMEKPKAEFASRLKLVPLGRAVEADEVAHLIAYLLSAEASSITGQTFAISGGE